MRKHKIKCYLHSFCVVFQGGRIPKFKTETPLRDTNRVPVMEILSVPWYCNVVMSALVPDSSIKNIFQALSRLEVQIFDGLLSGKKILVTNFFRQQFVDMGLSSKGLRKKIFFSKKKVRWSSVWTATNHTWKVLTICLPLDYVMMIGGTLHCEPLPPELSTPLMFEFADKRMIGH